MCLTRADRGFLGGVLRGGITMRMMITTKPATWIYSFPSWITTIFDLQPTRILGDPRPGHRPRQRLQALQVFFFLPSVELSPTKRSPASPSHHHTSLATMSSAGLLYPSPSSARIVASAHTGSFFAGLDYPTPKQPIGIPFPQTCK